MEITDKDLTRPAEELLARHKIEHGEAPAYNSSVIGLINQLCKMVLKEKAGLSKAQEKILAEIAEEKELNESLGFKDI